MTTLLQSRFNLEFEYKDMNYVYNTRTSSLAQLDMPLSEYLAGDVDEGELLGAGFVVPQGTDEVESLLNDISTDINTVPDKLELTIVLTEDCNFHCVYCYQTKKPKYFDEEDAKSLVSKIHALFDQGLSTLSVHYFGGEPLLNLSSLAMLDAALKELCDKRGRRFTSYLTTNGSLLTQDILRKFEFDTIQLTFDGNADNHSAFKVSNGFGYTDLMDAIELIMIESSSKLRIRFNICEENAGSFPTVIDDILKLKYLDLDRTSFTFAPMRNFTSSDRFTELSPRRFSKVDLKLRKRLLKAGKKLLYPRAISHPCKFSVGKAVCLGPNLRPYFCTSDFYNRKPEMTLEGFLRKRTLSYSVPDVCESCTVLPMCLCSCRLLDPDTNACISERYILTDLLKMYIDDPDKWIV